MTMVADADSVAYALPYSVVSAQELADVLAEECDYMYVCNADDSFCQDYQSLFKDGFIANRCLYRVDKSENGVLLVLEKEFVDENIA